MGQAPTEHGDLNGQGLRIGVATARWNSKITYKLEKSAVEELKRLGVAEVRAVRVPGAFEVPLACKALLEAGFDAVIALGCVIRGETTHYDYVCSSVERGCTELQIRTGKPVGFGILTTENEEQAFDRAGGKHGDKGSECAQVVVEMSRLLETVAKSQSGQINLR
jgi:6,7-dimethyl-8-ribityllumazine synthase